MASVKRPYRSPRREQQAQATKAVIVDAAHELFAASGYAATSIRAVAEAASVSEQTVYNAFGDKAGLLWAVGMRIVAGDPERDDPTDTELIDQLAAEPDPIARIRATAHASRQTWERGMLEFERLVLGADVADPRLRELRRQAWEHKRANTHAVAELLFPEPIRRPGLDLADIVDIVMAVDAAPTVSTLVDFCGWSLDQYEAWLADFLITQFLDPDRAG